MALKKCSECGHEISKKADACPSCGHPTKSKPNPLMPSSGVVLVVVIVAAIYLAPDNPAPESTALPPTPKVDPEVKRWQEVTSQSRVDCRLWTKENARYPSEVEITDVNTSRLDSDKDVLSVWVDGRGMNAIGNMLPFRSQCLYRYNETDDSITRLDATFE